MSDEELVRLALTQAKLIPYWRMEDDTRNEDELLSRLERGRKAIEFVEKLSKEYESFLISDASGEYDSLKCKEAFFKKLEEIIASQLCKEYIDEN